MIFILFLAFIKREAPELLTVSISSNLNDRQCNHDECDYEVIRRYNKLNEVSLRYGLRKENCQEKYMETTLIFVLMK